MDCNPSQEHPVRVQQVNDAKLWFQADSVICAEANVLHEVRRLCWWLLLNSYQQMPTFATWWSIALTFWQVPLPHTLPLLMLWKARPAKSLGSPMTKLNVLSYCSHITDKSVACLYSPLSFLVFRTLPALGSVLPRFMQSTHRLAVFFVGMQHNAPG